MTNRLERMFTSILLAPIFPSALKFPSEIRHEVRDNQHNRCAICGEVGHLQTHHKVPEHALLNQGIRGRNTIDNAVGLCGEGKRDCHDRADRKAIKERLYYKDGEFVPLSEIDPNQYEILDSRNVSKQERQDRYELKKVRSEIKREFVSQSESRKIRRQELKTTVNRYNLDSLDINLDLHQRVSNKAGKRRNSKHR